MKRNFIQFYLWNDCNNCCDFCFNRGNTSSNVQKRIENLKFVINFLQKTNIKYNEIGFIGGEFFDGQLDDPYVKKLFYDLFYFCLDQYKKGNLNKLYLASSLILKNTSNLDEFINEFQNTGLFDITLLCTSFDNKYRFHTVQCYEKWKQIIKTYQKFFKHKIHIETILSGFFIESCLSNNFNLLNFYSDVSNNVDYIEPVFISSLKNKHNVLKKIPDFLPSRKSFIKFIQKFGIQQKIIDINSLLQINLRANIIFHTNSEGKWIQVSDRWIDAKKRYTMNINEQKSFYYSDSMNSMINDVEMFKKII